MEVEVEFGFELLGFTDYGFFGGIIYLISSSFTTKQCYMTLFQIEFIVHHKNDNDDNDVYDYLLFWVLCCKF